MVLRGMVTSFFRLLPTVGWAGVAGGTRTLIAGVAPRDPVPLDDDHMLTANGRPGGTLTPVVSGCNRVPRFSATGRCAAREGIEPSLAG